MTSAQLPMDFDAPAAAAARDGSMEQVDEHAYYDWKDAALEAVRRVALRYDRFIVDDVWAHMANGYMTHDNRAMGPVIRRASALGWIAPTTDYQLSARVTSHRNPRRVWRSLIHEYQTT